MKRHSKTPPLDISIRGDELEYDRIQLEHNLQHTDLSFHLSSADEHYNESIELPRHNSGPSAFPDFPSFDQRSRDHFDTADAHSPLHAWSYRTADDEEGIHPYGGGETMSTAAHHASALTLSAGLAGGRAGRRDISLSGAEYDPDRPLHDMIAGVDSKLSVFDMEPSRSKYHGVGSITFDPLVVDSTAELDRVLQSGHAPPLSQHARSVRLRSPHPSSSSSSSASDSDTGGHTSRPKLSDALRRVSFSPKRPRSAQSNRSVSHATIPYSQPSPLAQSVPLRNSNSIAATPQKTPLQSAKIKHSGIFPSYPSNVSNQPEVLLHPPTPSTAGSKFTKMARGINQELESEKTQWYERSQGRGGTASTPAAVDDKNLFDVKHNGGSPSVRQPTPRKPSLKGSQLSNLGQPTPTPKGKIHLPDVTGLTSAVESPAKIGAEYYAYRAENREGEARLLRTLNAVQTKLHQLEDENSISRRRVRELEFELEVCKREVARERTRIMENEENGSQIHQDAQSFTRTPKGKGRAREDLSIRSALNDRYREAVEEKKALEALITSLRSHLTRLTSELSSHQELLTELRTLRNSDARALKEKSGEIDRLKDEVERLAGEVEVLRGVVEEGLKERRSVRQEVEVEQSNADLGMSEEIGDELEDEVDDDELEVAGERQEEHGQDEEDEEGEDEEEQPFDPQSIIGSSRAHIGPDRTMRTDHATNGSSHLGTSTSAAERFIDDEELERISAEVEERRTDRSASSMLSRSSISKQLDDVSMSRRQSSPNHSVIMSPTGSPHRSRVQLPQPRDPQSSPVRPLASTSRKSISTPPPVNPETPFPQIRGEHLERLFFTAPEHNAKTCTMCHRRRRPRISSPAQPSSPSSWLPSQREKKYKTSVADASSGDDTEDEGFAEGHEEVERSHTLRGKEKRDFADVELNASEKAKRDRDLPPQTVVARVIRELEDDFTHYKSIYVELADQYKVMDAASNVPKRNMLARHVREVVDILEQKGDQIASLYDLLTFKDKPNSNFKQSSEKRQTPIATTSLGRSEGLKRHPTFA